MPRPRSASPKTSQVNVRLTPAQADGLAALEFIEGITGPELLRDLLEAELIVRQKDTLFKEALRVRAEARARSRGELTVLRPPNEAS